MESLESLQTNFEKIRNAALAQREQIISGIDPRAEQTFLGTAGYIHAEIGAGDSLVAMGLEDDNLSA